MKIDALPTNLDISEDTNLAASAPITLTGDTIGWDSTLTDDLTWSDGAQATVTHTFAVTGTDPTFTFSDGLVSLSTNLDMNSNDIIGVNNIVPHGSSGPSLGLPTAPFENAYVKALAIDNFSSLESVITMDGLRNTPGTITYNNETELFTFDKDVQLDAGLTVNTTDLVVNAATGRVGIGTVTPGSKLTVFTDAWNTAETPLVNITNLDPNAVDADALLVRGGANNEASDIFKVQDYNGNTDFVVVGNGKVGIGEPSPEVRLEITYAAPYLTLHNDTEENSDGGRESRISFKGEQLSSAETTLARIEVSHDGAADDQKGKFVISVNDGADGDTPTDRFKIDAAGVTHILGSLTLDPSLNLVSSSWIGNSSTGLLLYASGGTPTFIFGRDVIIDNVGGTDAILAFDGTSDSPGTITYESDNNFFKIGAQSFSVDDTTLVVDAVTHRVGIGTADPDATLEIFDTTTQLKLSYDESNFATLTVDSGGKLTIATIGTGGTVEDIVLQTANFPNAIFIDEGLQRVGIGFDTPLAKFHMFSDQDASSDINGMGNYHIAATHLANNTGAEIGIAFGISASTATVGASITHERLGSDSYGPLYFNTKPLGGDVTRRMTVGSDGNVGINTTSPDAKLQVVGTSRFGGDGTNETQISATGDLSFHGTGGLMFGHMCVVGDITVTIGSVNPTEVSHLATGDGWTVGELNEVTFGAGGSEHHLTAPAIGRYKVIWSISGHTGIGGGTTIHGGVMVNNAAIRNNGEDHSTVTNSNVVLGISGVAVVDITSLAGANAQISLWVADGNSADVIVEHGNMYIEQIGGT